MQQPQPAPSLKRTIPALARLMPSTMQMQIPATLLNPLRPLISLWARRLRWVAK